HVVRRFLQPSRHPRAENHALPPSDSRHARSSAAPPGEHDATTSKHLKHHYEAWRYGAHVEHRVHDSDPLYGPAHKRYPQQYAILASRWAWMRYEKAQYLAQT